MSSKNAVVSKTDLLLSRKRQNNSCYPHDRVIIEQFTDEGNLFSDLADRQSPVGFRDYPFPVIQVEVYTHDNPGQKVIYLKINYFHVQMSRYARHSELLGLQKGFYYCDQRKVSF